MTTVPNVARWWALALLAAPVWSGGCAAFTNPTVPGIPVNRLPPEVLGRPRTELQPLPLTLFRQSEPDAYRVDKGDVLGVVVDGVLGGLNQQIPVQLLPNPNADKTAVIGYPIPVQDNGTIILPELPPIDVRGKTLPEVQKLIADLVTGRAPGGKELIVPGKERVLVDLIQKRRYEVLVVREDSQAPNLGGGGLGFGGVFGVSRKGAGFTLQLEAYENDLLRALNASGGPPGLDAKNDIVIRRGKYDPADPAKGYVRIPLRARPDEPICFTEADVILKDGDTVYIEARDTEVYYTAGLIGAFQIPLPRDYDLRVIEAISQVRGPLLNGGFSQTAFVANSTNTGVGNPNPSHVAVLRRTPAGQTINIRVDLNKAFLDVRENILIQPGDIVVLQERPGEALTRYLTQTIRINTVANTIQSRNLNQTTTGSNP
jgi:hypothetical protein